MYKKWIKLFLIFSFLCASLMILLNFMIDPYGIFGSTYFDFPKLKQDSKARLVKSINVSIIKPKSIVLGSSRADLGYNPDHEYFLKPSYNVSISGVSLFESKEFLLHVINQNNLKQVLLVADYFMFNNIFEQRDANFKSYFDNSKSNYLRLINFKMFSDSLYTIFRNKKCKRGLYKQNGQKMGSWCLIVKKGGHAKAMWDNEYEYYTDMSSQNQYMDTKRDSFEDFKQILNICHEKNIKLDIIFGPSHIRMWESLDYYLGFDTWLQWKKSVVIFNEKIAKLHGKKPFKIFDFSTYNEFTNEDVPKDKMAKMKWHWESSHYKDVLGTKVLNVLQGKEKYENFGVELSVDNIDEHLQNQIKNRKKFIDSKKYKEEFELFIELKRGKK